MTATTMPGSVLSAAFVAGQEAARRSRAEQGLPPTITVQVPK